MKVILASMYVCGSTNTTSRTLPDVASTIFHITNMLILPSLRRSRTGTFCKNMSLQQYYRHKLTNARSNVHSSTEVKLDSLPHGYYICPFILRIAADRNVAEAIKRATRDLPIACEALDARDTKNPYGKAEFDKWIGDFDVSEFVIKLKKKKSH
jgi:hypothetical protein